MRQPIRHVARFAALIAVAVLASQMMTPAGPAARPYASALSDLAVSSAVAAPAACRNRTCDFRLRKFTCVSQPLSNCDLANGGGDCRPTAC